MGACYDCLRLAVNSATLFHFYSAVELSLQSSSCKIPYVLTGLLNESDVPIMVLKILPREKIGEKRNDLSVNARSRK